MPKNNGQNVSYFGHTGHVENALGETFELDPTRTVDGEDVDGVERGDDFPEELKRVDDPTSPHPSANTDAANQEAERNRQEKAESDSDDSDPEGGEQSSAGDSSKQSSISRARSTSRTKTDPKSTAPETANR